MMPANPTVITLVRKALASGGYEGLFNADSQCGCSIDDLEPCGEISSECCAGYRQQHSMNPALVVFSMSKDQMEDAAIEHACASV